jgi:hypothetical protein
MQKRMMKLLLILSFAVAMLVSPSVALAAGANAGDTYSAADVGSAATSRAEFALLAVNGFGLPTWTPSSP